MTYCGTHGSNFTPDCTECTEQDERYVALQAKVKELTFSVDEAESKTLQAERGLVFAVEALKQQHEEAIARAQTEIEALKAGINANADQADALEGQVDLLNESLAKAQAETKKAKAEATAAKKQLEDFMNQAAAVAPEPTEN